MLQIVISAVRPWNSPDSCCGPRDFTTYDDQTQINLCLTCPIADDCVDCVAKREKRPWWKKVLK